ncbi:MAG: 3D domain-containing protein [Lachnospiraceae bacterium]|nr:3D domain-containing protein [Lachnospiraceae bacterium]
MLKKKTLWYALAMAAVLLLGSTITSYAAENVGHFEELENGTIIGWGWEPTSPNTAVPVHVTVTNTETSEVVGDFNPTAGIYHADLKEQGIGNGVHGFRITMDWDSVADGTYRIEGWVNERSFDNTLTCTKNADGISDDSSSEKAGSESHSETAHGLQSLGIFRTTGYCPCYQCSEGWGRHTSTGAIATSGHTIAVDPRVIPYGSKVMINGVIYTAEDRGGGVRGNHIDIFYDTHSQTRQHGSRNLEVFLVS